MALTLYLKKSTYPPKPKITDRAFYALIGAVGLGAVTFAVWPILAWQLTVAPRLTAKIEVLPIPQGEVLSTKTARVDVQVVKDPDGFSYFTTSLKPSGPRPKEFVLSIPKLKIQNARVKVDSLNFYESLAHFPGSAIPGEVGNSFITGHSVLPQFNDPKNYRAIFTKLSDLSIGDDVIVEIEGQTLYFTVQYAKIVDPRDTSVLLPISSAGRNLTLMTCVPPGTNTKRLVIITSLI